MSARDVAFTLMALGHVAGCRGKSDTEILAEAVGEIVRLQTALEKIETWYGQFPPTGRTWDDGSPMSYAACYGSNGERDFMRSVARQALRLDTTEEEENE